MTTTALRLSHCNLPVRDQDEALRFYRDVIGLEVRMDMPLGDGRWLTLTSPGRPDVEIILETPQTRLEATTGVGSSRSCRGTCCTRSSSWSTTATPPFGRVKADGAEVGQPPTDQPYGVRDCSFRDPTGNQVRFSQPLGA